MDRADRTDGGPVTCAARSVAWGAWKGSTVVDAGSAARDGMLAEGSSAGGIRATTGGSGGSSWVGRAMRTSATRVARETAARPGSHAVSRRSAEAPRSYRARKWSARTRAAQLWQIPSVKLRFNPRQALTPITLV